MTPEEITAGCLTRWKAVHDARQIDLAIAPDVLGFRLKRLWRHSPEWRTEFAGAEWLDHLLPVGRGYVSFRELVRSDLLLNLIPLAGPVRAPALVDEFVPPAPLISAA